MRFCLTIFSLLCVANSFAQSLGTKKDVIAATKQTSVPATQPMDLLQMLVAVVIVGFLVKWLVPKAIAKMGKRLTTPVGSAITLEESATFGGGLLQVVTVRNKSLLLSVASSGVTCLADLTQQKPPEDEQPAFFEMVDRANPANAIVTEILEEEEPEMSMDEALQLISNAKQKGEATNSEDGLERLNRLLRKS